MEGSYVFEKRKRAVASIIATKNGEVHKDVAPLFYVQSVIRNVENPNGLDTLQIYVNDHNLRTYEFNLTADKIHGTNITAELSHYGIMIEPSWHFAVVSHLVYGYKQCVKTGSIVYQNKVLGWYPFEGKDYYFFDETDFNGKHSICTRRPIEFTKGDKKTYLKFLEDTVFPSVELSLALVIGFSGVVVAKLGYDNDLRHGCGKSVRNFKYREIYGRNAYV